MTKKVFEFFKIVLKVFLVLFAVLIVQNSSRKVENKVENVNLNKTLDLAAMARATSTTYEAEEILRVVVGDLTGYAADCPKCTGFLGCKPYTDVRDGQTTYEDKTYGTVRIVAASPKNLKCGSIITFTSLRISKEPVIAIVLDRGVLGTDIDLLSETQSFAAKYVGRSEIAYTVLREGWESE